MTINAKLCQEEVIRECMRNSKKLFYVSPYIGWLPTFEQYKIQTAIYDTYNYRIINICGYIEARIDSTGIARDIIAIAFDDTITAYRGIYQFMDDLEHVYHCRSIIIDVVSINPQYWTIRKYCWNNGYKAIGIFPKDKLYGNQYSDVEFYVKVIK